MTGFFEHEYVFTAGMYSLVVISLIIMLALFEWVTSYTTWEQIKAGNIAVALSTAGKIFGVANIFRYSITVNDSVLEMLGWGAFGFILLIFVYFIFEFLTPNFSVDKELEKGNIAVGIISFILSTALSYVIGASI